MLDFTKSRKVAAGEIIPGDSIDTRCGIGDLAWKRVTRVRLVEHTATADEIEITLDTDAICKTRIVYINTEFNAIPA
jgi:hypothetical protein